MWSIVNQAVTALFDVVLWPVHGLSAGWQAGYLGVPGALLGLLVYRFVSDQDGIERAKNLIVAHLFELRLFKDDFLVSLRAQGKILRHNATYLRHALLPMAVMIVPFLLMLVQVESRFAFRGLEPGERALLTLEIDGETAVSRLDIDLVLPEGVERESPALRIDPSGEVVWRLRGEAAGVHDVIISIGKQALHKQLVVGQNGTWVATELYRANDWETLLYPQEAALPADGPARALKLSYPRARGEFAGLSSASWIFMGSSILFGLLLRGAVGVTF